MDKEKVEEYILMITQTKKRYYQSTKKKQIKTA